MGNIYTNKQGLRVMEVEYGWGMELEAIEYPLELAKADLIICEEVVRNMDKLEGTINMPGFAMAISYCVDTIVSAKKGERTYILSDFLGDQIKEIEDLSNKLKKINGKKTKPSRGEGIDRAN